MSIDGLTTSLAQVQAISFDLDDTLWDCAPAIANAENALFEWHNRVTPAITELHTQHTLQDYRTEFRKHNPELKGCVTAMRMAGLRKLLNAFDYSESLAAEGFEVFYKARSQVELYPGALDMLKELKQSFRLAAITNGNADLHSIGISMYFDRIYAANLTLLEKPAPDMFNLCLSEMDIPPNALLHIGDNPVTDIFGAQSTGVQTLWFNRYNETWPDHLRPPDFEVSTLSDIAALFQR
ncbi:HAD family hydrolase [Granulosicoccus sp.]|nr:HAD family hydrolase [Granulosicoccus sp.]MDB4222220.1 HAD family hydrolase [Granulosicoccus sp.]